MDIKVVLAYKERVKLCLICIRATVVKIHETHCITIERLY